MRDCPNNRQARSPALLPLPPRNGNQIGATQPASQNRPPAQGRVYAMARREAHDAPGVVTGTVSLCDHAAYALFDLGSSHSFVSDQFVELIGLKPVMLEVQLCVTTPLKDKICISLRCPNCEIVIGGVESMIDLAVLPIYDFDLIVGMDWLVKQNAIMDCSARVIQFSPA